MTKPLDLAQVTERDRLAFYGALFAIAFADGQIDKDEMEFIFGIMDLDEMSEAGKRNVQSYIVEPPSLDVCTRELAYADERLRYGLMVNLIEVVYANDELDSAEKKAALLARENLQISIKQFNAIVNFVREVRKIRERGLDDNQAADAIKTAAAGLSAVGVPIAAVYLSGSVIGLSAAGITSGLAALGLGLGMVPGIGVAVLVGAGIFMGVNAFLDTGDKTKKANFKAEQERKAQLVIKNMQGSINQLVDEIGELQEKSVSLSSAAADAEASREAIRQLTERLRFMKQSVTKRKQAGGVA
ncbi:MAG: hypothetical protein AB4042_13850 [Leptolyngbyaceae cyanobacterium]